MRLIETEMLEAVRDGRDWSKNNTRVEVESGDCIQFIANVYLHNHLIAVVWHRKGCDDVVTVSEETLRNWPTRTTMSRLRALGVDVCTRKGEVILNGKAINSEGKI